MQAFGRANGRDSATVVVDVTDFFAGDTPGIGGLTAAQRRQYQVRRLDPARSFVSTVRSFPMNVEVRHTQTFEAAEPPSDRSGGTLTLEMRQSLVLLPKVPMRPRYADARVGFFSVDRVNYGLDEQKAATERFIRRWRLEPKDTAAYARGELVEPVKPIVYYLDPATPAQVAAVRASGHRGLAGRVREGGLQERRSSRRIRRSPARGSGVGSGGHPVLRRALGREPRRATPWGRARRDPRTGEIIESDITWYHNHMRSYRNRLMMETGAANPAARTLDIPEPLMGETMRKVITHEVGHALGLPHNMVASSVVPGGLAAQAVVRAALRRVGDDHGLRAAELRRAAGRRAAAEGLHPPPRTVRRLRHQLGLPRAAAGRDAGGRAGDAARMADGAARADGLPLRGSSTCRRSIRARRPRTSATIRCARGTYAVANLKRVVPNLVAWTTKPGEDYEDLGELYGEAVRMWSTYMGHVVTVVGGMEVDARTADQPGAAYRPVPRARQAAALGFLTEQALRTPAWLAPEDILARIGPQTGGSAVGAAQANVLTQLLAAPRLARLADAEARGAADAYPTAGYLADLRRALWGATPAATTPDAARRALQRVHLERLGALVTPPPAPTGAPGAGGGGAGAQQQIPALLVPPVLPRTDLPALARGELRTLRDAARVAAGQSTGARRAHWQDVVDRVDAILEPARR